MAYPSELRARVLDAYAKETTSVEELAKRFGLARATIYNWRSRMRQTGSFERSRTCAGRPKKLDKQSEAELLRLAEDSPDATLIELCAEFAQRAGVKLSPSTVSRTLRKRGSKAAKQPRQPENESGESLECSTRRD
jgi:transposase